jgi:hypothetical protein
VGALTTLRRRARRARLAEAVSCQRQFCGHIPLHHGQCRGTQLGVEVGDGIGGNHDRDVTHVGVECAVEDALLGDLAGQRISRLVPRRLSRYATGVE